VQNPATIAANVVFMKAYRKPMKNPILMELLSHWETLRAGRIAPLRSEIDPRKIENVLEHAFVLERSKTGNVRFRIAGMRICDLMGMELHSMPAQSLIQIGDRAAFSGVLNELFYAPKIVELALSATVRHDAPPITADILLLPVMGPEGTVTRILGCLASTVTTLDPPHRFHVISQKETRIITNDALETRDKMAGFAESADAFIPASPKNRQELAALKHLKLVPSDD